MCDVHLRLIGKCVVDFLLVLIELFLLVVMAEVLRVNLDWKSAFLLLQGHFGPKFHVEGVAPVSHSCQKTRMNDLSCGLRMWAQVSFVSPQYMRLIYRPILVVVIFAQQHMETCRCLGRERWPMDHEVLLFQVLLSGTLCHRPYVYRPLHSDSFRVD